MKIAMGSPVKGLKLKTVLKEHLRRQGHEIVDVGCGGAEAFVKYPSVGERVARALQRGEAEIAINICGSGTGAAMGAGKFRGVLACACESVKTARLVRVVNGANCLCLGEDVVDGKLACEMADAFLGAQFQDAPDVKPEIRDFWKEARDEMMGRGGPAGDRALETLS